MGRTFFSCSITIPASTTWASPKVVTLDLPTGRILGWYIQGAPEHQHQVGIGIYHLEHRIFPFGELEFFYPSEIPAVFEVETEMTPGVRWVKIRGYNTDDTYEHTVYVGVVLEPYMPQTAQLGFYVPEEVLEGIEE